MTPLACSLFALAALLATAHADCDSRYTGVMTDVIVPLPPAEFRPAGARIPNPSYDPVLKIYQSPCPMGMGIVGTHILACNYDPQRSAPVILGPLSGKLFPMYVYCDKDNCPIRGFTQLTVYCAA